MRQVPYYLIIGDGRMATHFCHYLSLLHIPFIQWSRKQHLFADLKTHIHHASHILLLIRDSAIAPFQEQYIGKNKTVIHFSGQLSVEGIHSVHPLMTFTNDLYDLERYKSIPFVLIEKGPPFSSLFPDLPNPAYYIAKELKTFYHALCVIGNNFSCLLWKKLFQEFAQTLKLPSEAAVPYLTQTFNNIIKNPQGDLSGPLARKDMKTIEAHLEALKNDDFLNIYQSFVTFFNKGK